MDGNLRLFWKLEQLVAPVEWTTGTRAVETLQKRV